MGRRMGVAVAVFAAAVAAGAILYLRSVQEKVERVTVPVVVSAPDLYPRDTLLFAAVHGVDGAHAGVMRAWQRFEGTALHSVLEGAWRDSILPSNRGLRAAVESFDRSMDDAEKRLGYRPTTEDFFRVYGRFTAFGLVPAAGTVRPHMLAVVKLPDEGAQALLEDTLGGGAGGKVRRNDPPDVRGYPVFTEEPEFTARLYYGVGGGYLFVADALPAMEAALVRLDALRNPSPDGPPPEDETGAPASLAEEPGFASVAGTAWDRVALALFVRRDQQFARWHANLALLDEAFRGAFVLAPDAQAVTIAALRPEKGEDLLVRSSFPVAEPGTGAWAAALPAGLSSAILARAVLPEENRRAHGPAVERFRAKAIWREAGALLRDVPRLEGILRDALPAERVPSRDLLARLPRDVDLVAWLFDGMVERGMFGGSGAWAMFGRNEGASRPVQQQGIALGMDPLGLFALAGVLEAVADRSDGAVVRDHVKGALCWRVLLPRALERAGIAPELRRMADSVWGGRDPAIVAAGGRLYLCLGYELARDIRDIAAGRDVPALAADPLWIEATADGERDAVTVSYLRPGEVARAFAGSIRGAWEAMAPDLELPPETEDTVGAGFAVLDRVVEWSQPVRATVTWTRADETRPAVSRSLVDGARLRALGAPESRNAAPACLAVLPADTVAVSSARVPFRAVVDDLRATFLRALPGGRERADEMLAGLREEPEGRLALRVLEDVFAAAEGECGLALRAPPDLPAAPDGGLDLGSLLDRVPGVAVFASYADAGRAHDAAADLLERIARELESVPFRTRLDRWRAGAGAYPVGAEFVRNPAGPVPIARLRLLLPEGSRGPIRRFSVGVALRGGTVWFVLGERFLARIAGQEPEGASLADRLARDLPAGTVPAEVLSITAWRGTGLADCVHAYTAPLAPAGLAISLGGFREAPPPEDVVHAHREGWMRLESLVDDLLRDPAWNLSWTRADGDRVLSETRRVPPAE